jgi:hypothetical protein
LLTRLSPFARTTTDNSSGFALTNEFHMTGDSYLFKPHAGQGRLPLYEGKMLHQFDHEFSEPRYWIDEKAGRKAIIRSTRDVGQKLDYQGYRFGHRSVSSSTNERTMIGTILPPNAFYGHSINATPANIDGYLLLYYTAVLNSFVLDYSLRLRVSQNLTMFYTYQLPIPRRTAVGAAFGSIVQRAARLICTTPEFDALAKEVSAALKLPAAAVKGVTDAAARARLRAELDGLIAHLYGLTESEFAHILSTFPLVAQGVKDAALAAYHKAANGHLK